MKIHKTPLFALFLLAVCLLCSLPAFALDEETGNEIDPQPDTNPQIVCSLSELQDAIENAEEGDELFVGAVITIDGDSLCTDKKITLRRANDFWGSMIAVRERGGIISGFHFLDDTHGGNTISVNPSTDDSGVLQVSKCVFDGKGSHDAMFVNVFGYQSVHIYDCTFSNNMEIAFSLNGKNDYIENCVIENNYSMFLGAAFISKGNLHIKNSIITCNSSGIYNTGTLTVENCKIYGNAEGDIFNDWTMTLDTTTDGTALYDRETGEILSLPLESSDIKTFMCFTDEEAQIFFTGNQEDDSNITLPGDETPPDDNNDELDKSNELNTPDNLDVPDITDAPVISDNTTASDNSNAPDNTPNHANDTTAAPNSTSTSHTRPWWLSVPFDDTYICPVEHEETPNQRIILSSGGLTLDVETPLVLRGYGNGVMGENDPITRAQIAVLLYRSLTDDSKSLMSGVDHFADVSSGTWYYDAVTVLSSAGIINGCDGLFCPNDTLTLGQLITMLTRFVEPKETPMPDDLPYEGHWAYGNIVTAVAYGWIDSTAEIEPDRTLTRGKAVKLINSIFEKL